MLQRIYLVVVCFAISSLSYGQNVQYSANNLSEPIGFTQTEAVTSLQELFTLLSIANKSHSFHSLLTYEANGYITTFKLNHWLEDNTAFQQLMFMDGPKRKVIRQQDLYSCYQGQTRWGLWPTALPSSAFSDYSLEPEGTERIADRATRVFNLIPKDDW
ncbi:MAG: sigma-E factor regulatory protein RseB domain-containing protein [Pseudomonadota bacterium]